MWVAASPAGERAGVAGVDDWRPGWGPPGAIHGIRGAVHPLRPAVDDGRALADRGLQGGTRLPGSAAEPGCVAVSWRSYGLGQVEFSYVGADVPTTGSEIAGGRTLSRPCPAARSMGSPAILPDRVRRLENVARRLCNRPAAMAEVALERGSRQWMSPSAEALRRTPARGDARALVARGVPLSRCRGWRSGASRSLRGPGLTTLRSPIPCPGRIPAGRLSQPAMRSPRIGCAPRVQRGAVGISLGDRHGRRYSASPPWPSAIEAGDRRPSEPGAEHERGDVERQGGQVHTVAAIRREEP